MMNLPDTTLTIHFAPLLPEGALYALAALAVLLCLASLFLYKRAILWRSAGAAAFILILLNPSLIEEKRESVPDVAVIVVDRSPSQDNGARTSRTDTALSYLRKQLDQQSDLELRVVESSAPSDALAQETRLFDKLDQTLSDIPVKRRAGVIFLTDGQIHDIPKAPERFSDYGPVHGLLTGEKNERDRQLVILEAPAYGIVGQPVTIKYKVEDTDPEQDDYATVLIRQNNKEPRLDLVPLNIEQTLQVTMEHAGQNIFDIETSAVDKEITEANNRAPIIVNGVRDRLRVLLVSGQPHAGGRTWRNLLTSDPGVDLVHFTILREPNKLDATPQNELSLIAFPFRELFEVKLYDFDLIIFDRYRLNRILPNYYFGNIARYVKEGGALLEASGPSFATKNSIYTTALKNVLPAFPTGQVIEHSFKPSLTKTGKRHPVTQNLLWSGADSRKKSAKSGPKWGSLLRQVVVTPTSGDILMSGAEKQPLLILDRVGEGRVAQLTSDQIWLWSRGFEGGGPQAELLRRLAHWLMKEPELEENALEVQVDGNNILIRRRTLTEKEMSATMTKPDGTQESLSLTSANDGFLEARITAETLGIYTIDDGTQQHFAIVGDLNPPELRRVKTSPDLLAPLSQTSKGRITWLSETPEPSIRLLPPGRRYGGSNWIGLRQSHSHNVTGIKSRPFLPSWLYMLSLLALLISVWWFEGRSSKK